jgi:uncharacterized membrane protein (UPF0136 family)
MFTTVRYFIKTSIIFLIVGLLTGLYMSVSSNLLGKGYAQDLISAHTHLILLGTVMMMIMRGDMGADKISRESYQRS